MLKSTKNFIKNIDLTNLNSYKKEDIVDIVDIITTLKLEDGKYIGVLFSKNNIKVHQSDVQVKRGPWKFHYFKDILLALNNFLNTDESPVAFSLPPIWKPMESSEPNNIHAQQRRRYSTPVTDPTVVKVQNPTLAMIEYIEVRVFDLQSRPVFLQDDLRLVVELILIKDKFKRNITTPLINQLHQLAFDVVDYVQERIVELYEESNLEPAIVNIIRLELIELLRFFKQL